MGGDWKIVPFHSTFPVAIGILGGVVKRARAAQKNR